MFIRASAQQDLAYRANFVLHLFNACLNLAVGVLGLVIVFGQVQSLQGWNYSQALALLGVYLTVGALRGLFIGPSLDSLAGLEGEVMKGNFDFTLLRPVDTQFLVTFRQWRLFSLFDLALGAGVIVIATLRAGNTIPALQLLEFGAALLAAALTIYAVLLAFTAFTFWSPGFLFTWVFDALFQLARYPVGIYPSWLRFILNWIVPVGVMTTIPASVLTAQTPAQAIGVLAGSLALAGFLLAGASWLFRRALHRYASASS
jgi:ABC-2 type transport system permease protein